MPTAIKLLNQDLTSHGGCRWVIGEWKGTDGTGDLCGPGWLHCYDSAELAVLMNPIHAHISDPTAYRVEVAGAVKRLHGLNSGYTRMRLMEPVTLPLITLEHRMRFALACALHGQVSASYRTWALRWLDGTDRTSTAAESAWAWAESWSAEAWAARAAVWLAERTVAESEAAAARTTAAAAEAAWAEEEERIPPQDHAEWALSMRPWLGGDAAP